MHLPETSKHMLEANISILVALPGRKNLRRISGAPIYPYRPANCGRPNKTAIEGQILGISERSWPGIIHTHSINNGGARLQFVNFNP